MVNLYFWIEFLHQWVIQEVNSGYNVKSTLQSIRIITHTLITKPSTWILSKYYSWQSWIQLQWRTYELNFISTFHIICSMGLASLSYSMDHENNICIWLNIYVHCFDCPYAADCYYWVHHQVGGHKSMICIKLSNDVFYIWINLQVFVQYRLWGCLNVFGV